MKKIDGGREEWEVGPVRLITLLTAASQMQVTSPLYPLFASVTGVSLAATKKTTTTTTTTTTRLDSGCRGLFHFI